MASANPSPGRTWKETTELRHLSIGHRRKLIHLLDIADAWRDLAAVIVKPGSNHFLIKNFHIRILEEQKHIQGSSPSKVLLEFWSTFGRFHDRPRIGTLIELLKKVKLTRIASFVSQEILGLQENANLEDDDSTDLLLINSTNGIYPSAPSQFSTAIPSAPLHVEGVDSWSFSFLSQLTNNFDEVYVGEGGKKIGEGAFGAVFRATLTDGRDIAVKLLKGDFDKQFLNEIQVMKNFIHENLLQLIAVSTDGPSMCLVSPYMSRGSLNAFLSQHGSDFSWRQRLSVSTGTARGLSHLHSFLHHPVVHRDVKSDNILLDNDLTPKLGDFGLTRIGSHGTGNSMTRSKQITQNVIGTSVYMPPEAFRGDVSVKLDVFAFGIVLLELLTGLRPYDERREDPDLLTHVQDQLESLDEGDFESLQDLLDNRISDWDPDAVLQMFSLSMKSTSQRKKDRPNMTDILATLQGM